MKVNELITKLTQIVDEKGDLDIVYGMDNIFGTDPFDIFRIEIETLKDKENLPKIVIVLS